MLRAEVSKVTRDHLSRQAYLYVRQSSLHQVEENQESTRRQYALRERAVALGWRDDQIEVIDSDQGESGASQDRAGFKRLVSAVGMAEVGLVLGLEVSRLARNSADWHRLLEMCALTDTLLLDEDGLYDPGHFNDRLLLGMKGTMSEAELHLLRARLQGGLLNKARRGELKVRLPLGFIYDDTDRVIFDPNLQVQESIRLLFETFRRVGSAMGVVTWFKSQGLLFPRYAGVGQSSELLWRELDFETALRTLHNVRYAGVYFYGRTRQRRLPSGRYLRKIKPMSEWDVVIPDAHEGYISRQQFEDNQRQLQANAQAIGADRRRGPAREGPALLQGLVICGRCGRRMTISYKWRKGVLVPVYYCQRKGEPLCQSVQGSAVDEIVSKRIVELVSPLSIEASLKVQEELEKRHKEADDHRLRQLEQMRYDADQARRRYLAVDPDNRLVAAQLEAEWNRRLNQLDEARAEYDSRREKETGVSDADKERVRSLVADFRRFWQDEQTSHRDRKRLLRLLLEDATLLRRDRIYEIHLRFRGGVTESFSLEITKNAWQARKTSPEIVARIDSMLDEYDEWQIVEIFEREGLRTQANHRYTHIAIQHIQRNYGLKKRSERLRARGLLSTTELAARFRVGAPKVNAWRNAGLLKAHRYSLRWWLYEDPTPIAAQLPGLPKAIKQQLTQ